MGGRVSSGGYNPVSEQLDSCPEKRSNATSDAAERISASSAPITTRSLRAAPHAQSFTGTVRACVRARTHAHSRARTCMRVHGLGHGGSQSDGEWRGRAAKCGGAQHSA